MSAGHHCCGDGAREKRYRRYSRRSRAAVLIVLLLALSTCSGSEDVLSSNGQDSRGSGTKVQLAISPLELEARSIIQKAASDRKEQAELRSRAKKAMEDVLFDPASAQYSSVRAGSNGAVCGKVNAKNRYGAYVGFKHFVVSPEGQVEISTYGDGLRSEPYSSFAAAYVERCATPTERKWYKESTSPSNMVVENLTAENLVVEDDYDPFAE